MPKRSNNKKSKHSSRPEDRVATLAKTKLQSLPRGDKPTVYSGFVDGMVSNPTAATKELQVSYSTFFDINNDGDFPFTQVQISTNDNDLFVIPAGASEKNMLRVRKAEFYCLPQFSTTVGESLVAALFSVPAASGSTGSTMAVSQQTTMLTPTAISDWVKVGEYNENHFNDTQYVAQVNGDGFLALGTLAVVNPDTGETATVAPIQTMVKIQCSIAVPNYSSFLGAIATANNSGAWHSFVSATPGEVPAMVQPGKITNVI